MIRSHFPILSRTVHGNVPWIYLDNAATTQKPQSVIDAITTYYTQHNSNVHRGAHTVSAEATALYEASRDAVKTFLHAERSEEIIFTKGTTESINLVASAWGDANVTSGDEILVTGMEHHANIVPWHMLCQRTGAVLRYVPVLDDGGLDLEAVATLLTSRTKLFAMTHVSNTTGAINPVKDLCAMARQQGITTLVDGAQAVLHLDVDVQDINCDFYAFSGHKLYGPTGIGVLYGRYTVLDAMPPYQGGGSMIRSVSFTEITYNDVPTRFETGTPHIAGAVGLHAAIDWYTSVQDHQEHEVLEIATQGLLEIDGLRIIGTTPDKIAIISFVVDGVHGSDIGMLLDEQGIAVRTGHHCTQPLMQRFGVTSTCRASFAVYNTVSEAEALVQATRKAVRMLR